MESSQLEVSTGRTGGNVRVMSMEATSFWPGRLRGLALNCSTTVSGWKSWCSEEYVRCERGVVVSEEHTRSSVRLETVMQGGGGGGSASRAKMSMHLLTSSRNTHLLH